MGVAAVEVAIKQCWVGVSIGRCRVGEEAGIYRSVGRRWD
jgi:hypothetical protein